MLKPGSPYGYRDTVRNKENSAEVCREERIIDGPVPGKDYLSNVNADTSTEISCWLVPLRPEDVGRWPQYSACLTLGLLPEWRVLSEILIF
jgi:hypothetical protein